MTGRSLARTLALLFLLLAVPGRLALSEEDYPLAIPAALRAAGPVGATLGDTNWLAGHQLPDGHWSAMDWDRWCLAPHRIEPRPSGRAGKPHDLTVTSLSLLATINAGYSHRGRHFLNRVVRRGIGWLERRQGSGGDFARPGDPDPVGGHALATRALLESYGSSRSEALRGFCRRALIHLLAGQAANGAWKRPGSREDDALATLWAAGALKSAALLNAYAVGMEEPVLLPKEVDRALRRSAAWFDTRTDTTTGVVRAVSDGERRRGASTLVLTAAGALVRTYVGQEPKEQPTLRAALEHLLAHPPSADPRQATSAGLYVYLGTLATFAAGGKVWSQWKNDLNRAVIETQIKTGTGCEMRGSWDPCGTWTQARGRVAMTPLMHLTLHFFYRYEKVFGRQLLATMATSPGAMASGAARAPRLHLERAAQTWKRSALPVHSAQFNLARGGSLPIDAAHLRAQVHGLRAQVVLDLFVTNTKKDLCEGVLDLRLPDGAAPYYLAFGTAELAKVPLPGASGTLGTDLTALHAAREGEWGAVREARMAPVTKATEAFETIVRKRRDPALLTWSGAGVFHLRVFPLEPGKQHRITVAYEVDLTPVGEDAELALAVPRAVHDLRVAVSAPGANWSTQPEVKAGNGVRTWHEPAQEVIRVRIANPGPTFLVGPAADGSLYTAAWVQPEIPEVPRTASPRAQFLIDVSKSAGPDYVQVWRTLVPAILEANRDQLKAFSVGFFDVRTTWWRDGFVDNTPENVAALRIALDEVEPGGATDLAQALASARERAEAMDLFLFTDGFATWGESAKDELFAQLRPDRPVFAYGPGLGEHRHLLRAVAERSGGTLVHVMGAADVPAAARAHRHEPWTIEAVALPGVSDVLVEGNPRRLHPGQRLRLTGRGQPEPGANLFLRLRRGDRQYTLRQPVPKPTRSPMAARAYGQAGVRRLEAAGAGVGGLAQDYAAHFRVVRKSCALVMLESEKDYNRFGLNQRGHAQRVAARPVLTALARMPAAPKDTVKDPAVVMYARDRGVPPPLLRMLRSQPLERDAHAVRTRAMPPADKRLRALSGVLEGDGASSLDRWTLALYASQLGLPGHVVATLCVPGVQDSVRDWFLARAAVAAKRPLLALAAYEAALGRNDSRTSPEIIWIIGADYERHLARLLTTRLPDALQKFVAARAASLKHWRRLMGAFAPPRQADLVILHMPHSRGDPVSVEVHSEKGVLHDTTGERETPSALISIPEKPQGTGLQMTALRVLPQGACSVHLVRPPAQEKTRVAEATRSLVVIIRDWGRPSERIEFARTRGPDDDSLLLQLNH